MLQLTRRSHRLLSHLKPIRTVQHSTVGEAHGLTEAADSSDNGHNSSELDSILARVRQALLPEKYDESENIQVVYTGYGHHLGIPMTWQLHCRPDGAFTETIKSKQLDFQFGFDGGQASKCWEVDYNGVVKMTDLDDHEAMLIGQWVRTGFWATNKASNCLRFRLHPTVQGQEAARVSSPPHVHALHLEQERKASMQHSPPGPASSSQPNSAADDDTVALSVQLANEKIVSTLTLDTATWRPIRLQQPAGSLTEVRNYQRWEPHETTPWFASLYRHFSASGSESEFIVSEVRVEAAVPSSALFAVPPRTLLPPGTRFDRLHGGKVDAWWTPSGHLTVNPFINGTSGGYMILDSVINGTSGGYMILDSGIPAKSSLVVNPVINGTQGGYMIQDSGASGLVIEKDAADRLGLESFGKLHAAGIVGNVQSCYRRGESLQLGPLTIEKPLFMQISIEGIVRGAPGPIIGIIGYDVFIRCVMEIPSKSPAKQTSVVMHDFTAYQSPADVEPFWQPLRFVASLPIVTAEIAAGEDTHRGLFMLDSGAGGVDLMFHERATRELKLLEKVKTGTRNVKGVGGGGTNQQMMAQSATLPWVRIGKSRFAKARALCVGPKGMDLSYYTYGIICADLMSRCRVVMDFPRSRIALQPQEGSVNVEQVDEVTDVSVAKPS